MWEASWWPAVYICLRIWGQGVVGSSIRPLPRLLPFMKKVAETLYFASVARTMVVKL